MAWRRERTKEHTKINKRSLVTCYSLACVPAYSFRYTIPPYSLRRIVSVEHSPACNSGVPVRRIVSHSSGVPAQLPGQKETLHCDRQRKPGLSRAMGNVCRASGKERSASKSGKFISRAKTLQTAVNVSKGNKEKREKRKKKKRKQKTRETVGAQRHVYHHQTSPHDNSKTRHALTTSKSCRSDVPIILPGWECHTRGSWSTPTVPECLYGGRPRWLGTIVTRSTPHSNMVAERSSASGVQRPDSPQNPCSVLKAEPAVEAQAADDAASGNPTACCTESGWQTNPSTSSVSRRVRRAGSP